MLKNWLAEHRLTLEMNHPAVAAVSFRRGRAAGIHSAWNMAAIRWVLVVTGGC
ncbi:hypothetical protein ACNKHW_19200 [Shigella flexneri]